MQYVQYYVCFHVDQNGERGKALALEKSIVATEEVPSEDEILFSADPVHSVKKILIKKRREFTSLLLN